jgi:hypothetical protein
MMKIYRYIFFIIILLSPFYLPAQADQPKGIIKGRVIDSESKLDPVGKKKCGELYRYLKLNMSFNE